MENKNQNSIYINEAIKELRNYGFEITSDSIPKTILLSIRNHDIIERMQFLMNTINTRIEETQQWLEEEQLFYGSMK